jgi:hypothetical protein
MNDTKSDRNPITHKIHRKEVFWQITFPLILGIILILGLSVWTIFGVVKGAWVSKGADISLIFLILPTMVIGLLIFAVIASLAYAVIWLINNTPTFTRQVQYKLVQVRDGVRKGSDKLVEPIIRMKSRMASLEVLKNKNKYRKGTINDRR